MSCPLCGADVVVEPNLLIGDATCPRCGQLLWFIQSAAATQVFDAEQTSAVRERALEFIANQLGVDPEQVANHPALVKDLGADSLDTMELVMELERELRQE